MMMRPVVIFFNDEKPYLMDVGLHLNSIRLEYPDGNIADLPVMSVRVRNNARREEYYVASDRELNDAEVTAAINEFF
ncbi:TPA: hypothetical protein QIY15_001151 [Klebsiella aerogenes]|nr:hypothetical protein [Klebsiella aerogenes]